MASIFAGTAFNQVIEFNPFNFKQNKIVYGPMCRNIVNNIVYLSGCNQIYYSTSSKIYHCDQNGTDSMYQVQNNKKILKINQHQQFLYYCLSDGTIQGISLNKEDQYHKSYQITTGDKNMNYSKSFFNLQNNKCLLIGKNTPPAVIFILQKVWKGKNVKHDQLDLQVPMNDVDGKFINDSKGVSIIHAKNMLRIYDIRGTHKRPVSDIKLKSNQKASLTCMRTCEEDIKYYISNDIGQIYQMDSRKNYEVVGKFKGITTTITSMQKTNKQLIVGSLDGYVRTFDLQDRKLKKKYYINKPIHSLCLYSQMQQQQQQKRIVHQQQYDLYNEYEDQQQTNKINKVKSIRKRNKIGLKYLRPRQFDDIQIKEEVIEQDPNKWMQQLNPVDRRQFEHDL